ncbi:MAG TPA: DUF1287 domain-containing protein [Tenuifilaceae bacterium]|nr:DUF1287 domain-containing protein [Tenuifilaceae bacterium]HPJ47077.1 DUF1287 domain-containing protein [Tenuifilaceae bacterium]HPQ34832.1 DUF1287 domain-containing protein [Tenuifilaceae bacterium]HRX68715.1 DUF1287 domain-containing protein [Tenuifilaceae bacterium]
MKNWLTTSKYLTTLYLLLIAEVTFSQQGEQFAEQLSNAAIELTKVNVSYDATYRTISYPNGDVPPDKGVCTDLVIRAYRKLGIDLQKEVHEDMQKNFNLYPKIWGLTKPDKNIDHRRVPNLMVFFERFGEELTITSNPTDYKPGEIVTWDLGGGVPHIGIVINKKSSDGLRYLIVHNIGNGQEISDCLFTYKVTGHYQYPKH